MSNYRLRCGVCVEIVEYEERVYLDIINTIMHQSCYDNYAGKRFGIKDQGTYDEMLNKYSFFEELRRK